MALFKHCDRASPLICPKYLVLKRQNFFLHGSKPNEISLKIGIPSCRTRLVSFSTARAGNAVRIATSVQEKEEYDSPVSIELEPISSEEEFHQAVIEAQKRSESIIISWVAAWCRKCIHLKPKLEKLAADYYPDVRFYCVDVNIVPHALVSQAAVIKMPAIQLWKGGKKRDEVIAGHDRAWMAIADISEMIDKSKELD